MKIVLSRKGFDSSAGGVPSPIFPDGQMVSLPIPSKGDKRTLGDLEFNGINLGALAADLSGNQAIAKQQVHLDPDLYPEFAERHPGWLPAFGQTGIAQSHLAKHRIGVGDVFVFYGWFRPIEKTPVGFRYAQESEGMHVIYGWLQVGKVWSVVSERNELLAHCPAAADHPHVANPEHYTDSRNTLYLAQERLSIPGVKHGFTSGAGPIVSYDARLRLSLPGRLRSLWRLPTWFLPGEGKPPLTYHSEPTRWSRHEDHVRLSTVGRGQEFVLDADFYPEAKAWLTDLLGVA